MFWLDICEYNRQIMACTKQSLRFDSELWKNLFVGSEFQLLYFNISEPFLLFINTSQTSHSV